MRWTRLLGAILLVMTVACLTPGRQTAFAAQVSMPSLRAAGAAQVYEVFIRLPSQVMADQPLPVVIALHGMGGNGVDFAAPLAEHADRNGWLIVAPTIRYGDWTDHKQIRREDPALVAWLSEYIGRLSQEAGVLVDQQVLLFGHSRGAQLGLRFSAIHPEQVAGVAAVAAGTYTLPATRDIATGRALEFPFGVANLARDVSGRAFDARRFKAVPVWIGVGANDSNPADVPDAWDAYIGDDRRQRAETFTAALRDLGVDVTLAVFPGADHGLTDDMRAAACAALAEAAQT